jgi:DNA-binding CsgD family transcriptional regulator
LQVVTLKEGPGRAVRRLALLTRRERQVLRLVSCGQQNKDIADALGISTSTVKGHVAALMSLGFANRTQVARWALLHPHVFGSTHAIDIQLHFPGCPCGQPRCEELRQAELAAEGCAA